MFPLISMAAVGAGSLSYSRVFRRSFPSPVGLSLDIWGCSFSIVLIKSSPSLFLGDEFIIFFAIHSVPNHEELQKDGTFKHCHDNSFAQQDREMEKKVARRRLYVVSIVCLLFMIGEIAGKSFFKFLFLLY